MLIVDIGCFNVRRIRWLLLFNSIYLLLLLTRVGRFQAFDVNHILEYFIVLSAITIPKFARATLITNTKLNWAHELFAFIDILIVAIYFGVARRRICVARRKSLFVYCLGQLKFEAKRVEFFVSGLIVGRSGAATIESGRWRGVSRRAKWTRHGVVVTWHVLSLIILKRFPIVECATYEHVL